MLQGGQKRKKEKKKKKKKGNYHVIQQFHFWVYKHRRIEIRDLNICTPEFIELFAIAKGGNNPHVHPQVKR